MPKLAMSSSASDAELDVMEEDVIDSFDANSPPLVPLTNHEQEAALRQEGRAAVRGASVPQRQVSLLHCTSMTAADAMLLKCKL